MTIEIETTHIPLVFELDEPKKPAGVSVHVPSVDMKRSAEFVPVVALAIIYIGRDVSVNLFANWLWDKIRGKKVTIKYEKRVVTFNDEGDIKKFTEERIELEE